MSDTDLPDLPDDPDEALAAEYVLRLLSPDEEARCAARLVRDAGFAAEVARWEAEFAGLDGAFVPVAPPAWLRRRIEAAVFGPRPPLLARLWANAGLWRGVAAAAVAAAVAVGVFGVPGLRPAAPELVVTVAPAAGEDVQLVALLDRDAGVLRFIHIAGTAPAGQSFELWVMPEGDGAPTSLGLVPAEARFTVPLPPAVAGRVAPGTAILVSREAAGGSTGTPTLPPIASGAISEL